MYLEAPIFIGCAHTYASFAKTWFNLIFTKRLKPSWPGAAARMAMSGAVPQGAMQAQSRAHKASGSSGDLLYIASVPYLTIMSYPQGKVVTRISARLRR